jgi:hypothetical protein
MTEQEMLARIQELEEENAILKHTKKKVYLLERFEGKYPWIRYSDTTNKLSTLIRQVCFHEVEKPRKRKGRTGEITARCLLQTVDMTDEQRAKYVAIAEKLIALLDEYEVITESESFLERMHRRNTYDKWYEEHYGNADKDSIERWYAACLDGWVRSEDDD